MIGIGKNWEGVIENVKGRLGKWRCLIPKDVTQRVYFNYILSCFFITAQVCMH